MADKTHRPNYEKYIKDLANFMDDNGCSLKPFPKVHLSNKKQKGVFIRTGYYDPSTKEVYLLVNQRHMKDVLRSLAHELVHHHQNLEGRLTGYSGDTLGQDEKLDKLESEAYLLGNILFRKWTETKTKSENMEKIFTKHMKKKVDLNEQHLIEAIHEIIKETIEHK